ncbi:MAG: TatD family hydrolase [Bacteroidales bacterium]
MKLFDLHTHRIDADDSFSIYNAKQDEDIALLSRFCSVGIHPWFVEKTDLEKRIAEIKEQSFLTNVVAIGECGLDKISSTDFELQIQAFESMVEIAETCCKPLILHCVKAFDELILIRNRVKPIQPWVIHGFRGNATQLKQLLAKGFCFSIGEKFNVEAIKVLPLNAIFVETDDSELPIESIYRLIAVTKQMSVEELSAQIEHNVRNILKINL